MWIALGAGATGFVVLFIWLMKWRDPDWTEEDEKRSFFWQQRRGSGGMGS